LKTIHEKSVIKFNHLLVTYWLHLIYHILMISILLSTLRKRAVYMYAVKWNILF